MTKRSTIIIFCIVFTSIHFFAFAKGNLLSITGTAPTIKNGTAVSIEEIVPKRLPQNKVYSDTKIDNNSFELKLNVSAGGLFFLSVGNHSVQLFLEPGPVKIAIADTLLQQVKVSGSVANDDFVAYSTILSNVTLFKLYSTARHDYDVYMRRTNGDSLVAAAKMRNRDSLFLKLHQQLSSIASDWINAHPKSAINSYVLFNQLGFMPENSVETTFKTLTKETKTNTWGKELTYRIDSLFNGGVAPDFKQPDTSGRIVNLADFKGRYVLVTFWASWCAPCRDENPELVDIYHKFEHKNFAVIGISLDRKRAIWLNAIKNDRLPWTHLSNLQGWDNGIAAAYYVNEIPMNFLIGPDGRIITKDVHGKQLSGILQKLLN